MIGIDDMALYIPSLYLPLETLANERNIPYAKLNRGLGLTDMAVPDIHEDPATMAANAIVELIEKNDLDPRKIGRIYMGTESALDGSKPTATYVLRMLRNKYRSRYGKECFLNCDVVDLTFACVGGVDALHNILDWVRNDEERMGIVVCSDIAKYELASTGEYTQGAGAIALMVKHHPRLMANREDFGVATSGVHDFFKPRRTVSKLDIIKEVLELAGVNGISPESLLEKMDDSFEVNGLLDENDEEITIQKETPVYDGPYSNDCYRNRIREALRHLRKILESKGELKENESLIQQWGRLVFHLPYAFQAKRMFSEIFMLETKIAGSWNHFLKENALEEPQADLFDTPEAYKDAYESFLKSISKSDGYRRFVVEKIEKGQRASSHIGNMYACSIFLSLMSILEADLKDSTELTGSRFGFFGYGSGSKSKVFEGIVQPEWKEITQKFRVNQKIENRFEIDYPTYEALHKGKHIKSVRKPQKEFSLKFIQGQGTKKGARYYEWNEEISMPVY